MSRRRLASLAIALIGMGGSAVLSLQDVPWFNTRLILAAVVTLAGLVLFFRSDVDDGDEERIGVRAQENSRVNLPGARMQGMTIGIDSKDSDVNAPNLEVK